MLRFRSVVFLLFFAGFNLSAQQKTVSRLSDSVAVVFDADTLSLPQKAFKPSPKKAVLYSAIFPGLGQIYNRKYWKLPIIYGGFVGFSYAISWNNSRYQDYFAGYKDIIDDDPKTVRWHDLLPYGQSPETVDTKWFSGVLKDRKNYFRYYRDLSIILTVAWYALGIIDAYVDAQLFEFDVSPDLSMHLEPTVLKKNRYELSRKLLRAEVQFPFLDQYREP